MATREKKLLVGKRNASPVTTTASSTKELRSTPIADLVKSDTPASSDQQKKLASTSKTPNRKLFQRKAKNLRNKNITIKLKSKAKKNDVHKLALFNTKNENKKIVRNGIGRSKTKKSIGNADKSKEPPVLEPIFENNIDTKTLTTAQKRRIRKVLLSDSVKKIKLEIDDSSIRNSENVSKGKGKTKIKVENDTISETIECVINDLNVITDIKKEPDDSMSESSRSDIIKPKPLTKKQKLELLQKEIKKEAITIQITELNQSDQKVIDMLDLNVNNIKKMTPEQKRRHTIEKFQLEMETVGDITPFKLFSAMPRSLIPKIENNEKIEMLDNNQNMDLKPPIRKLRNSKQKQQREIKQYVLEQLGVKKRKRLCSEQGSDVSKMSGYESDSSFSDVNNQSSELTNLKYSDIKQETTELTCNEKISNQPLPINQRSLSMENYENSASRDNNSNVTGVKTSLITNDLSIQTKDIDQISKIPEKLMVLDFMKQTFNESIDSEINNEKCVEKISFVPSENSIRNSIEQEICDAEQKDVEQSKMNEIISKIVETMGSEEFRATISVENHAASLFVESNHDNNAAKKNKESENVQEELPKTEEDIPFENFENVEEDVEMPTLENNSNVVNGDISEEIKIDDQESDDTTEISAPDIQPEITNDEENKIDNKNKECSEDTEIKESMLKALGLQSLKAVEEAKKEKDKVVVKNEDYTGTLKTVIKINRDGKKKGKNSLKMTLQKNKHKNSDGSTSSNVDYKIMKESNTTSSKNSTHSSDAGAHRKTHYSNRSNMEASSEQTSDGEMNVQEPATKALVIPEKASSFSIHPERLCKDECSYCFGKFGLFDTPCHIAQIKTVERQDKILASEVHLTRDSCLCDACYRHIDRKANTPSYINKSFKRGSLVAPGPKENHCHVLGCSNISNNVLRRKWIIKMKKSICQVINIDLDNPGLHSIPLCDEHYIALEHLMVCAMCKRRLAKNHIHYLGPEVDDLNNALQEENIPLSLSDKPVVCKLCKCFATLILKNYDDRPDNCSNFLNEYKKRLLHFNNIVPMDEAAAEEPLTIPSKEKYDKDSSKKRRKSGKHHSTDEQNVEMTNEDDKHSQKSSEQNGNSGPESPSDYLVDYNNLIPSIAMDCNSDAEGKELKKQNEERGPHKDKKTLELKDCQNSDNVVKRLSSNSSISFRQLFPGEEELNLQGSIDFHHVKERTPEGWEKCNMVIQYDRETKQLWQELQKPYGNPSSFLRHLILLEKYFRNGDLELKNSSSQQSENYTISVKNRLRAYDNIPATASSAKPLNIFPFNHLKPAKVSKSSSGIITGTVLSKDLLNSPNVSITSTSKSNPVTLTPIGVIPVVKSKPPGGPPGLISLNSGTTRPTLPVNKPQSQKIKFPITKNWRPTLIPIDTSKPCDKKGLVQVISGGKPFHITLEDYKKMCAIKRSFEMRQRQKKMQEMQLKQAAQIVSSGGSVLKNLAKKTTLPNKIDESAHLETNILDKLDQQVENLESKFNDCKNQGSLPKIPKSLTVIPQTVQRKCLKPPSPNLLITTKPNSNHMPKS